MRNLIWVRILIAGLALLGGNSLASENSSNNQDVTSFIGHVVEITNNAFDTDSDNPLIVANHWFINISQKSTNSYREFGSKFIPVQARYSLSFPHAPPVFLF